MWARCSFNRDRTFSYVELLDGAADRALEYLRTTDLRRELLEFAASRRPSFPVRILQAARDGIVRFAADELGLELLGLAESPIRGREMGNVEYLSYWRKPKG